LLALALAGWLAAGVGGGCGGSEESSGPAPVEDLPDQEVLDFSLTETVSGVKAWTLFADRAEVYGQKGYSKVYGVKVHFYSPEGELTSVLTSERGRVDDRTKNLQAFGNVVVRTSEGVVLETESLRWDNRLGKITSSRFVTITRGREVLSGYGFTSEPDLSDVRVLSDVKITVRGEEADSASREDISKGGAVERRR
jgi:LPS export ABC transporter protein LptC